MRDLEAFWARPRHVVFVCGAAVSGAEAAAACADRDILTIVLEQNARPYGKIEDGLPRWHDKLRSQEYGRIDECLSRPNVLFVPRTVLGRDVKLEELTPSAGVAALLLANGAWRDRPLPVPGVDALPQGVDQGFMYQNKFVHWFNHYDDRDYDGPRYQVPDGAIVVGGGLASIDVVKILHVELYRKALQARGIDVSVVELEHQGIPKTLAAHKLTAEQLGIRGATLYYRRRVRDMPVASPKDDSPEQLAKTEGVREKLVGVLAQKYLVRVEGCHAPVAPIVEHGKLAGLRFRKSELQNGKLVEIAGSDYDVRAPLTVSSIGSVPEPIAGVPRKGELYDFANMSTGEVRGLPHVFGLGNVLTGKGNIKDSRESARDVSNQLLADYLGVGGGDAVGLLDGAHTGAAERGAQAADRAAARPVAQPAEIKALCERVRGLWSASGFDGDYRTWIAAHPPS
jgi:NADPH-dependent glutamate synthase beta subunit-like oxidoreductase